jgi:hypothetical protein
METRGCWRSPEFSPNPGEGYHFHHNAETYYLVGKAIEKGHVACHVTTTGASQHTRRGRLESAVKQINIDHDSFVKDKSDSNQFVPLCFFSDSI